MPTISAFGIVFAFILLIVILACVVGDLLVVFLVLRRRISPDYGLMAGAAPVVPFLLLIVGLRDALFAVVVAILSIPIAVGVVTIWVALLAAIRSGMPRMAIARRAPLALAGVWAVVYVAGLGVSRWRCEALEDAVRRDDVDAVRWLLAEGAARDARDAPLRQGLLVQAAGHASLDVVTALLDAGADPNGSPLLAAILSRPRFRTNEKDETDPATHARNRYRTVEILLDRGADPSGTPQGGVTPAELAWGGLRSGVWPDLNGDADILRLLKARGARDGDRVSARFGEMVEAAAAGDTERLRAVLAEYRGEKPEEDAAHRSLLVTAAENGHLAAIEALLTAYGDRVHCDFVEKAKAAAARHNHPEVLARLRTVCGSPP
jgi:hypothetical protein